MQSLDIPRRYRQVQRATVARSALDVIALVFLGCGFAFWSVAFWQLLTPPAILSLLSIQAIVLALAFSLAAPLLLSMLVPTTPAGQMLQKTQYATVGFTVIAASALFMVYQAEQLIALWLTAQPGVADAHFETRLAIVLVIAFVVIPALAWVQLSPERWLAAIQQAHAVKKLELQQRGELAIIKAKILRAERLAVIPWVNLLPLEKEEIMSTVRGLLMAQSDSQRDIVRTLDLSSDLEKSIMDDADIAEGLAYIAEHIDVLSDVEPAQIDVPHQDAAPVPPAIPAPQRPAARGSAPQRYAAEHSTAVQAFGSGLFTVASLAEVLDMKDRTARDRLNAWLSDGRAADSDTRGHFYLTEREAT